MKSKSSSQLGKWIEKFGSATKLATALGHANHSTVYYWKTTHGFLPVEFHRRAYEAAIAQDLPVEISDFCVIEELCT